MNTMTTPARFAIIEGHVLASVPNVATVVVDDATGDLEVRCRRVNGTIITATVTAAEIASNPEAVLDLVTSRLVTP